VKNFARTVSLFLIAILYCFAVVTANSTPLNAQHHISSDSDHYLTVVTTNLYSPVTPSNNSVELFSNTTIPVFNITNSEHWALTKASEDLLHLSFLQYTQIAENALIRHRKSDIIFPSHYFW
jgi:hypothetical protein